MTYSQGTIGGINYMMPLQPVFSAIGSIGSLFSPAISLAVVDYVEDMSIDRINAGATTGGAIINAVIAGLASAIRFQTWEYAKPRV